MRLITPRWISVILLGTVYVLGARPLQAQSGEFRFDHLTLEDGLSQSEVAAILQDRVGFMWFGTRDGLNRYDGYSFVVHRSTPNDSSTISSNIVTSLCEPQNSEDWEIWVGTRHGLNQYNPNSNRFNRYLHDPADTSSITANQITSLIEDREGRLWIGTERGLNLRLPPLNAGGPYRFARYRHQQGNPFTLVSDHVTALVEDRTASGTVIWVGTRAGLNRMEILSAAGSSIPEVVVTRYPIGFSEGNRLSSAIILSLKQSEDGTLWVGTQGEDFFGISSYGGKVQRHRIQFPAPVEAPLGITGFQDHGGFLWVGTFGAGINLLDPATGTLARLQHEFADSTSLGGDFVLQLFRDRSGRLWVSTTGNGLSMHSEKKRHFAGLRSEPWNPNSLSHRSVLSVFENVNGEVWIGTVKGLNRYDPKRGAIQQYRHDAADPSSLPSDIVYAIEAVPGTEGQALWVGTLGGLSRMDAASGRFTPFRHNPANPRSLPHNRVQSILVNRRGQTWIGTDGGVACFDAGTESFENYRNDPDDPGSLVSNQVLRLFEDSRGRIWVATARGISRLDPRTGRSVNFDPASSGLSDEYVYSFCETAGETGPILWIGTRNGLNRFDADREHWTHFYESDGLPSAVVLGVMPDRSGNLWLSTFHGLSRFDPLRETFQNFTPADGLQSYEFNWGAFHCGASGTLYAGGIQGLNWFHPGYLAFNPTPPPVVLTSIRVLNRELDPEQALPLLQKLELSHDQNALSFEFAALDYTAPDENRYAYVMEGVDSDWIDSGNRRYASYTELSPGAYRFKVRGSNNDGVWNEEGAVLEILVNPPIWRTWVAYLFYALGIISIVFAVERARAHRLKLSTELSLKRLESRKLAELDQLKTRFFTDITHEFRTPLTLIQGSLERLPQRFEQVPRDLERIQENTNRLTSLIDQILDLARVEAGKMVFAPAVHDLADFTRFVVSCFSSLAESGGVELTCKSPDEPVLVSFDSDQLEKCLSNLLTNALKFTPSEGTVTVHLRQDSQNGRAFPNGYAELKVEDTGVGIPEDQLERVFDRFYQAGKTKEGHRQGSGVGLALTRELVRLHGGEIWADSGELKGSSFTIRLPLVTVDVTLGEPFQTTRDNPTATYAAKPIEAPTSTTSDSRTDEEFPEVLVVDDHPDIRRLLQDALEPDHIVRSAANGNEAFEQALEAPPDLIVSDVMMPDLDGYQLCRHLRKDRRTSHIPIIMLTAKAGRQDRIEGLQTGADAYLTKPFSREELLTRVRNLIKQREQLREKYPRRIQLDPKDISITSTDELFLRRVMQIVEEQLSAFDFSVAKLASHVGLSRVQLHRKIRALTGESPTDFIRTTRLRLAARLLARGGFNVTQAAYEVGFQNLSYFAKCFRDRFGVSPSEYAKNPFEEVQG